MLTPERAGAVLTSPFKWPRHQGSFIGQQHFVAACVVPALVIPEDGWAMLVVSEAGNIWDLLLYSFNTALHLQ